MEKVAWKGKIKPGCEEEYISRHNAIWPEMVTELKMAGIANYTIWRNGTELFGYYECSNGVAFAQVKQAKSQVVKCWNEFMQDVLELEMDPLTGAQPMLECVFTMD